MATPRTRKIMSKKHFTAERKMTDAPRVIQTRSMTKANKPNRKSFLSNRKLRWGATPHHNNQETHHHYPTISEDSNYFELYDNSSDTAIDTLLTERDYLGDNCTNFKHNPFISCEFFEKLILGNELCFNNSTDNFGRAKIAIDLLNHNKTVNEEVSVDVTEATKGKCVESAQCSQAATINIKSEDGASHLLIEEIPLIQETPKEENSLDAQSISEMQSLHRKRTRSSTKKDRKITVTDVHPVASTSTAPDQKTAGHFDETEPRAKKKRRGWRKGKGAKCESATNDVVAEAEPGVSGDQVVLSSERPVRGDRVVLKAEVPSRGDRVLIKEEKSVQSAPVVIESERLPRDPVPIKVEKPVRGDRILISAEKPVRCRRAAVKKEKPVRCHRAAKQKKPARGVQVPAKKSVRRKPVVETMKPAHRERAAKAERATRSERVVSPVVQPPIPQWPPACIIERKPTPAKRRRRRDEED
ncbi:uncharacterized protein LOC142986393 [Anticarsia gemmatalis]|uniref:uncharacterized protein LOC142986393 n=1 Tax=Anticarsia gemmatalis TaxID=129554 RepID=UPI003F7591ED